MSKKKEEVQEMMEEQVTATEATENGDVLAMEDGLPLKKDKTTLVADLVESWSGGVTSWTEQLRSVIAWAEKEGYGQVNYEVHKPMRINRKKMLDVMNKFPDVNFIRSLYGNFYEIGGEDGPDILVTSPEKDVWWLAQMRPPFISTTEDSFAGGEVGCYIRAKFPEPCKYETFPQGGTP